MAKLEDLLALHVMEWPTDNKYPLEQDANGDIYVSGSAHKSRKKFYANIKINIAEDFADAIVYYKDWLAARDRLHAEAMRDNNQFRESVNHLEKQMRTAEDQELWDKVAIASIPALIVNPSEWSGDDEAGGDIRSYEDAAKAAAFMADAFMTERAKRLAK